MEVINASHAKKVVVAVDLYDHGYSKDDICRLLGITPAELIEMLDDDPAPYQEYMNDECIFIPEELMEYYCQERQADIIEYVYDESETGDRTYTVELNTKTKKIDFDKLCVFGSAIEQPKLWSMLEKYTEAKIVEFPCIVTENMVAFLRNGVLQVLQKDDPKFDAIHEILDAQILRVDIKKEVMDNVYQLLDGE